MIVYYRVDVQWNDSYAEMSGEWTSEYIFAVVFLLLPDSSQNDELVVGQV